MVKQKSWDVRVLALVTRLGSVEATAAKLGVSYFTILRWKAGRVEPSIMGRRLIEREEQEAVKV
jgi:molybdenum-dependent DNA-binding transcriptional regulator ModE